MKSDPKVIKVCEWFDDRFYKIEFKNKKIDYFPSYTTKLQVVDKPGLRKWYGDIGTSEARKRTNDAGNRGSRIHHGLEVIDNGGAVVYQNPKHPAYTMEELIKLGKEYKPITILENQDEMYDIWKVRRFVKIVKPLITGIELVVYDTRWREAGTIDRVYKIKAGSYKGINQKPLELEGGLYITDFKSGGLYDDAYMQIAGYRAGFEECYPKLKIIGGLIIHTGNTTKCGIPGLTVIKRAKEEMNIDYRDFRAVAKVWDRKNKNAMPKLFEFPALISKDKEIIEK